MPSLTSPNNGCDLLTQHSQLRGMLEDIRMSETLEELYALESLKHEYPHVFTSEVRHAITEQKRYLKTPKADNLSRATKVSQQSKPGPIGFGQLHLFGSISKFCTWCRRLRYHWNKEK